MKRKRERNKEYKRVLELHKKLEQDGKSALCPLLDKVYLLKEFHLFEPEGINGRYIAWFSERGVCDYNYTTNEVKEHQRTVLEFCIVMTS